MLSRRLRRCYAIPRLIAADMLAAAAMPLRFLLLFITAAMLLRRASRFSRLRYAIADYYAPCCYY